MKRKGKPVSRQTFDKVVAYYKDQIAGLDNEIAGKANSNRNLVDRCSMWAQDYDRVNQAKVAAEVERDQLKVRLENAVSDRDLANAAYQSLAQRYSRLARHRELLLDVMTSAEDAGADFSSIHRSDGFGPGDGVKP